MATSKPKDFSPPDNNSTNSSNIQLNRDRAIGQLLEGYWPMIRNDRELMAAKAQIDQLHRVLEEMRRTAPSDEFRLIARSTRHLIERMQCDILDSLTKYEGHLKALVVA